MRCGVAGARRPVGGGSRGRSIASAAANSNRAARRRITGMAEIAIGFIWHERSWRTLWFKKERTACFTLPQIPEGEWVTVNARLHAGAADGEVDYISAEMERPPA